MTLNEWLASLFAFHARQRQVDALARLSDHLLDDIGLRRDQLDALRLDPPEPVRNGRSVRIDRGFVEFPGRASLKGCG